MPPYGMKALSREGSLLYRSLLVVGFSFPQGREESDSPFPSLLFRLDTSAFLLREESAAFLPFLRRRSRFFFSPPHGEKRDLPRVVERVRPFHDRTSERCFPSLARGRFLFPLIGGILYLFPFLFFFDSASMCTFSPSRARSWEKTRPLFFSWTDVIPQFPLPRRRARFSPFLSRPTGSPLPSRREY